MSDSNATDRRTLRDFVEVCGSKNAGPFLITLDVICRDAAAYETVTQSGALTPATIAKLYSVDEADVRAEGFPLAFAIKFVIPRLVGSGDIGDSDVYGCQQHVPLLSINI